MGYANFILINVVLTYPYSVYLKRIELIMVLLIVVKNYMNRGYF